MERIMAAEIWVATPPGGLVKVTYTPHVDDYPKTVTGVQLTMPPGYDPNAPNHPIPPGPPPTVIPLLQGFNVSYGADDKRPADHHVRQLHVEVNTDGWYDTVGDRGVVLNQGPGAKVTVGLRDNSGGFGKPPPLDNSDDPFIARVYFSFLVIYP
jgi:hypothetical protein